MYVARMASAFRLGANVAIWYEGDDWRNRTREVVLMLNAGTSHLHSWSWCSNQMRHRHMWCIGQESDLCS